MKNNYIEIGKIVNTFGIKGELKIQSDSDFVDYRYQVGKTIVFKMRNILKEVRVSSFRILKGNVVITINDLYDINQVEQYIGATVLADKNDVPPLEEGEFMIDDIVGLDVYDVDNKHIGKVIDVIIIPASDILEIECLDGKKVLVPYCEDFIIDILDDRLVIKLPEVDYD